MVFAPVENDRSYVDWLLASLKKRKTKAKRQPKETSRRPGQPSVAETFPTVVETGEGKEFWSRFMSDYNMRAGRGKNYDLVYQGEGVSPIPHFFHKGWHVGLQSSLTLVSDIEKKLLSDELF